ncbi:MAG: SdrD B-like domain-containing protein, partial [Candidatus Thorarchaeota archaeon]
MFDDENHNGIPELGESGIPEVTVQLYYETGLIDEVVTNYYGQYTLRTSFSGQHDLTEFDLPGYVSTTPNNLSVSLTTGSSGPSPVAFGDFYGTKITGKIFNDTNVNGVLDAESGLPGALVSCGGDSFNTSSDGSYTLYVSGTGLFNLTEVNPTLWDEVQGGYLPYVSTNAIPGSVNVSKVDADRLRVDITSPGTVLTGNDFGDVKGTQVCTVSGMVFDDLNANGLLDVDETGLAGVTVALSGGMAMTTGSDGLFLMYYRSNEIVYLNASFYVHGTAGYEIEGNLTLDENYIHTNAIPGHPNVSKVDSRTLMVHCGFNETYAENMFGVVHKENNVAVVSGYVFYDEDENGVFNASSSDFGIPDMNVTLEIQVDDETTNEIWALTDSNGSYKFAVLVGTEAWITSMGPEGLYPTTPESVVVSPPSPGVYPGNNFGYSNDTDIAVIFGLVFYDWDGDGLHDIGEVGLDGGSVDLLSNDVVIDNFTTSGDGLIWGTFTFIINETGTYGLSEINPAGYWSTTPDKVNVLVHTLGLEYYVDFGNTNRSDIASIYGSVFNDIDGDGIWNIDELGIPGVNITMDGVIQNTTDVYGGYAFTTNVVGIHTIQETDLLGYLSTTPNEVHVDVDTGNSYEVNFGDILTGERSMKVEKKVSKSSTGPWLDHVEVIAGEDQVWYNVTVTNTEEETLSDIIIWDDHPVDHQISLPNTTLSPGESMSTTYNYPAEYGHLKNTVDVNGAWYGEITVYVENKSSAAYTGVLPNADVSVEKKVSDSSIGPWYEHVEVVSGEDIVYYNVTVTNSGELPLESITVGDSFGPLTLPVSTILSGKSTWVNYSRLAESGYVINIASASGTYYTTYHNYGVVAIDFDTANYTGLYPDIEVDKQVYGIDGQWHDDAQVLVGETVWYRFNVENTGGLNLTGVSVVDDILGAITMPKTELAVGESMVSANVSGLELGQLGYHNNTVNAKASWNEIDVFYLDTASYTGMNYATISGSVYNDSNGTEVQEPGEVGLSGVTVTLKNGSSQLVTVVTASDGSYSFLIFEIGDYLVTETNPSGWHSTTPNEVNVTVNTLLKQDVEVDFGDIQESELLFWKQCASARGDNYTSPLLKDDRLYRIEISKQFRYNNTLDGRADAMYYSPDGWTNYYPTPGGHSFMQIDGRDIAWGAYNIAHVYSI